jgi:hypothetical protein
MGYYTTYNLTWEKEDFVESPKWVELVNKLGKDQAFDLYNSGMLSFGPFADVDDLIGDYIERTDNIGHALDRYGSERDSIKWYNHEKDMGHLSEEFPDILFSLNCLGEDGERWMIYALNGATQEVKPEIVYPPCTLR